MELVVRFKQDTWENALETGKGVLKEHPQTSGNEGANSSHLKNL